MGCRRRNLRSIRRQTVLDCLPRHWPPSFPQRSAEDLIQQAAESQYDIEQVRTLKAEAMVKALLDRAQLAWWSFGRTAPKSEPRMAAPRAL